MGRRDERLGVPDGSPQEEGLGRRDFVKACMMAAAAVGLPASVNLIKNSRRRINSYISIFHDRS